MKEGHAKTKGGRARRRKGAQDRNKEGRKEGRDDGRTDEGERAG
jgi:hypothetical protein